MLESMLTFFLSHGVRTHTPNAFVVRKLAQTIKHVYNMDARDNGMFVYDDRFPPLCIHSHQPHMLQHAAQAMGGAITQYLQESYREGLKHEHSILPSGLSVGEAGVLYFRELHSKRRRLQPQNIDIDQLYLNLLHLVSLHLQVDLSSALERATFDSYLQPVMHQCKQPVRKILPALKRYVQEHALKTKGYTAKLRLIMRDLHSSTEESAPREA
jgi:hypothetical protein